MDASKFTTASAGVVSSRWAAPQDTSDDKLFVHLAGRLTDVVYSFLGPATTALAEAGHRQSVVVIEDPRFAHLIGELDHRLDLIVVKNDAGWRCWSAALPMYWRMLRRPAPEAIHFHGFIALCAGGLMSRACRLQSALYYSPHGSSAHGRLKPVGSMILALLGRWVGVSRMSTIVDATAATGANKPLRHAQTDLIDSPVADVYFSTPRSEAPHPVVFAGGRSAEPEGAHFVAQMSTVFSGAAEGLSFQWLGAVGISDAAEALRAAGVRVVDDEPDSLCAAHLSVGWLFVAGAGGPRGFPVHLAQAMSMGLPCVVADTPSHRALVEQGRNGFIFSSHAEAQRQVAQLIDSAELRSSIGAAAKASARSRFRRRGFEKKLLGLYQERMG
jgi:hypothetical protein